VLLRADQHLAAQMPALFRASFLVLQMDTGYSTLDEHLGQPRWTESASARKYLEQANHTSSLQ
jgi:hypothetical protein